MVTERLINSMHNALKKYWLIDWRSNSDRLALLLGAFVLSIVFVRTFTTNLNYDAAYTYLHYAFRDLGAFLQIDIANNHPLNSLLVYISAFLFPYNDLAIRFPALIAATIYVLLAINISKVFRMRWLILTLLLGNYLVIQYLGYARGYVFAVTLVLAAMFVHLNRERFKEPMWTIAYLLLLAVSAYIPSALILLTFLGYDFVKNPMFFLRQVRVRWIDSIIFLIVLSYFGYVAIRISTDVGKVIFGGEPEMFWDLFIGGFVSQLIPAASGINPMMFQVFALVFVLSIGWVARRSLNRAWIGISLIGISLAFFIRARFFGELVPIDRLLIPFWPLFAISVGIIMEELFTAKNISFAKSSFDFGLGLVFLLNLAWQVEWTPRHHFQKWLLEDYPPVHEVDSSDALIEYYLTKDQWHHIRINSLLSEPADFTMERGDSVLLYVFKEKRVIMTSVQQDLRNVIFLHAYPKNVDDLPAELVQIGFKNLDANPYAVYMFNNRLVKVHHIEDLAWDYLLIGQYNDSIRYWTEVVREI